MSESKPPFDYLAACSQPSLESFELSRLNQIANLRRKLRELVEAWIEAEVEAQLARWVLEHRRSDSIGRAQPALAFPDLPPLPLPVHKFAPRRRKTPVDPAERPPRRALSPARKRLPSAHRANASIELASRVNPSALPTAVQSPATPRSVSPAPQSPLLCSRKSPA